MPTRYDSLDVWRGVACLLVMLFHSACGYVRPGGDGPTAWLHAAAGKAWAGVPLFFVISGYCITAAAVGATRHPRPAVEFLRRRFWRVYPPMWAYLAVTAVVVACLPMAARPSPVFDYGQPLPMPGDVTLSQWIGTVTLAGNWMPHPGDTPALFFTGQLWSLAYEVQFYLVAGLALLLPGRYLFPALAGVTAVVAVNAIGQFWPAEGTFLDGLWLAFAAGVAVYVRTSHPSRVVRLGLDGMLAVGLAWSWKHIPSAREWGMTLPGMFVAACGFALILGWLRPLDARLMAARSLAPFRFCGRMCYSLYLIHAPVVAVVAWNCYRWGATTPTDLFLVTVPACGVVSITAGYAFYRLVELPLLRIAKPTPSAGEPSRPLARLLRPRPSPCT